MLKVMVLAIMVVFAAGLFGFAAGDAGDGSVPWIGLKSQHSTTN